MKAASARAIPLAAGLAGACGDRAAAPVEAKEARAAREPQRRAAPEPVEARPAAGAAAGPLDELFSLADPNECETGADFRALLDGLIHWEEAGESYRGKLRSPPVPGRFRAQVGAPSLAVDGTEYRATMPLRGTWQGLPLRLVVLIAGVESESGFYLVFDAMPAQVLAAANRAGMRIPASGFEYREEEYAAIGVNVGVEPYEGGAALYCVLG